MPPSQFYEKKIFNDHHLLGFRWNGDTWEFWSTKVSLRRKQAYFDARIGNIYTNWGLHYSDKARDQFHDQHSSTKKSLMYWRSPLDEPHMLLGVKMTRDNYNVKILHIQSGQVISFRHKEYNHWYAVAYRPEK